MLDRCLSWPQVPFTSLPCPLTAYRPYLSESEVKHSNPSSIHFPHSYLTLGSSPTPSLSLCNKWALPVSWHLTACYLLVLLDWWNKWTATDLQGPWGVHQKSSHRASQGRGGTRRVGLRRSSKLPGGHYRFSSDFIARRSHYHGWPKGGAWWVWAI